MPPKPKPPPLLDVFFDIQIDGQEAGRITFHLFDDVTPKTAANFRALSCGLRADGETLPEGWTYVGVPFHRIIPGMMGQGGDFEKGDGSGGRCIYERKKFKDENMRLKHDKPGLLSMANAGKDTNGSQFFITFKELPHLNRKHVVFGAVTSGMDVVEKIEACGSKAGAVSAKVIVSACGTLPLETV